jgi:membrane associated rhomboid family serine protease
VLIPLGTDQPKRRPTLVTWWLIAANVLAFAAMAVLKRVDPGRAKTAFEALALSCNDMPGQASHFQWWGLVTYQFLHGGLVHLLGNCLFLFVFGPLVEDRFGRPGYAVFYLAGGALAGATHLLLGGTHVVANGVSLYFVPPVIGASGSIAAVTGAFLVLFPLVRVRVLMMLLIIGIFTIPAWWLIIASAAWDLAMAGRQDAIAHAAHLGGYAVGFATAWALLALKVIQRQPYDLFSIHKQAARRRAFKEAVAKQDTTSPWTRDTPADRSQHGARSEPPASAPAPDDPIVQRRTQIARLLAEGQLQRACAEYERLLDVSPDATLHQSAQLELANGLFAAGRHQAAAVAYELLLARHPSGAESHEVRLLLALINARYLNDPVHAKRLLAGLRTDQLSDADRALADTLHAELG